MKVPIQAAGAAGTERLLEPMAPSMGARAMGRHSRPSNGRGRGCRESNMVQTLRVKCIIKDYNVRDNRFHRIFSKNVKIQEVTHGVY